MKIYFRPYEFLTVYQCVVEIKPEKVVVLAFIFFRKRKNRVSLLRICKQPRIS